MEGIIPVLNGGDDADSSPQSHQKAIRALNKVQKDIRASSEVLTSGPLSDCQSMLGDVHGAAENLMEMLDFPNTLREQVASFGDRIISLQDQAENLREIPFSAGCTKPLIQFLNAAAKPVRAIRDAATQAEEVTLPAKENCSRAIDLVGDTKGKVDWLQNDMGRVVNMVDKFAGTGKNALRAAKAGNDMMEVADNIGFGKYAATCISCITKSQLNSGLLKVAIDACQAVYDTLTLCQGCTDKVGNLKGTMEEGNGMMSREVNIVGDSVGGLKGKLDDLIDDITSFNLSGIASKCADLKGESEGLLGASSNGDALKRKVETKISKPLEMLTTVVDAIQSLFQTLQEQTQNSEAAEKKTREAPTLDDGKPDLAHMENVMKETTSALRKVVDIVAPILGIELEDGLFDLMEDDNDKNTATNHVMRDDDMDEDDDTPLEALFGAFASKIAS